MNEQEEFLYILNYFVEKYHLKVEHPYNDCYIVLYDASSCLGGMNYEGYNLLYNLTKLTELLKSELR